MEHVDAVHLTDRLHAEQGRGDPFAAAVRATRMPMVICDPRQDDVPIVFVNDAFIELTGYKREEILGRNCRFLQGPETDRAEVAKVRRALDDATDVSVEILNYRKDRTTFWNALYMSPVFSEAGELQFFFASQFDVTDRKSRELQAVEDAEYFEAAVHERTRELETALTQKTTLLHEVDHRVKNNLQMVAAMIRNQSRFSDDPEVKASLATTMSRVEMLGTVHRRLYQSADVSTFDLADFVKEASSDLVAVSGRSEIGLELDLKPLVISSTVASPLALLVNELMTNALKHAFPTPGRPGTIRIRLRASDGHGEMIVEDDGVGMGQAAGGRRTFGHKLIESLVRQVRGTIAFSDAAPGTRASVTFATEVRGV